MNRAPDDAFLPTRQSLLSRLRDWNDQDSWRQFFETYWRLIYDVAVRAGLDDAGAQDVVQETVLAAAKQLPEFQYDREKGSFKGWLLRITRRRIADALRQHYRAKGEPTSDPPSATGEESGAAGPPLPVEPSPAPIPSVDETNDEFTQVWEAEWKRHLAQAALQRLKAQSNPLHYQAFELLTVQEWSPMEVSRSLGIHLAQVYLIRSRLRRQVRALLEKMEQRPID